MPKTTTKKPKRKSPRRKSKNSRAQKSTFASLSKKEQALITVLIDPNNQMKNVVDICKLVPCDRKLYYAAFKKKNFIEVYNQMSIDIAKQKVGPVINAFAREAVRGSFQHGKVLLTMAGVYKETVRQEMTGADGGPIETNSTVSIYIPDNGRGDVG